MDGRIVTVVVGLVIVYLLVGALFATAMAVANDEKFNFLYMLTWLPHLIWGWIHKQ